MHPINRRYDERCCNHGCEPPGHICFNNKGSCSVFEVTETDVFHIHIFRETSLFHDACKLVPRASILLSIENTGGVLNWKR